MFTVVLSLIILAAVLLVLVILAQNSKGGGLTSQFGGSGASGPTDEFIERAGEQATPPAPIDLGTEVPAIDDSQTGEGDSSDSQ